MDLVNASVPEMYNGIGMERSADTKVLVYEGTGEIQKLIIARDIPGYTSADLQ